MSTASWRKSSSVVQQITENPHDFDFIQIVRLLESAARFEQTQLNNRTSLKSTRNNTVGFYSPPSYENIRFHQRATLTFPTSQISEVWEKNDTLQEKKWHILTHFMSIVGGMGVLPYHYSEYILQRLKEKDIALLKFLDLFHHRTVSLFYRASTKYRLHLEYNRVHDNNINKKYQDDHTQALLSIIGLGTKGLNDRQFIDDQSLIFFSGILSQKIRSASGLEQILSYYFKFPIHISQFVGQWESLIDDVRSRLPDKKTPKGQNVCLGRNAMLGSRGWFAQGKIRINIGPLNKDQYDQLAPGTQTLKALNELTRMYLGLEYDYDFNIQVQRKYMPRAVQLGGKQALIVGWNTWLDQHSKQTQDNSSLVDIHVSPSRIT